MTPPDRPFLDVLGQRRLVPATILLVAALALVNWLLQPEHPVRWLRAMLLLPAVWLGLGLWHRATLRSLRQRGVEDESTVTRYFGSAMAMSVAAVGVFQVVKLGVQIWVEVGNHGDLDVERRLVGLAGSAVLLVIGNALSRRFSPPWRCPGPQAALVSTARRFVGMTMVILGLASALAYLRRRLPAARTDALGRLARRHGGDARRHRLDEPERGGETA
ncbi:MAG: hypothetical protein R2909_15365 [Gemmatimonadales bacterium]